MAEFEIRPMLRADIPGAVALQRACFPEPFPEELLWTADHLDAHLGLFPEGQFIAVSENAVIASCSNCVIPEEAWRAHGSWDEITGGPFLANHDSGGSTLYGLDVSVHPHWRGRGVMRALYHARIDLVRDRGLTRYGTAVRIPGYAAYRVANAGATPDDYVRRVASGEAQDRTLTPMLRVGLSLKGVIRDYMEDRESHNAAAVLEWRP